MDPELPRVLIIDDEPNIRSGLAKGLRSIAAQVDTAGNGEEGLRRFEQFSHEIVITDLRLPGEINGLEVLKRIHQSRSETCVIVMTAYGSVETAVEAMRRGAFDFVTKPVDLNVMRYHVARATEDRRLRTENRQLRDRLAEVGETPEIIGTCPATRDVLRQIRQVAQTDATVLILGESGTGKELTARAIHQLSPRREKPFVTVNLGALPETLLESELFGYEKGAFTDARRQKLGCFEAAHGGTLFLDEITETSPKSQIDLLRVLEQREVRRLGGDDLIPVDVRIISATNADVELLVAERTFREDLYYRLNVVPVQLPPLRERADDIPLLVEHFLAQFCERHRRSVKRLSVEAMRLLTTHRWPGNIRQLKNLIERLVVTVESPVIETSSMPLESRTSTEQTITTLADAVMAVERQTIQSALVACDFHRERTARLLDVSVRTLQYKMSHYGMH